MCNSFVELSTSSQKGCNRPRRKLSPQLALDSRHQHRKDCTQNSFCDNLFITASRFQYMHYTFPGIEQHALHFSGSHISAVFYFKFIRCGHLAPTIHKRAFQSEHWLPSHQRQPAKQAGKNNNMQPSRDAVGWWHSQQSFIHLSSIWIQAEPWAPRCRLRACMTKTPLHTRSLQVHELNR
jgi:hypothetical protein